MMEAYASLSVLRLYLASLAIHAYLVSSAVHASCAMHVALMGWAREDSKLVLEAHLSIGNMEKSSFSRKVVFW
jgi:predicted FMN-binding regulatory protein PaiB